MIDLDWACPYPSGRSPVFARNIVATSQPLAAGAGVNILRRGGNAVDAAVAAAITLTVVEPANNGIGSDAFALVHDGQSLHGLNASGRSPAKMYPERFKNQKNMPTLGWDSVTVPGAVSAWVSLSERFGALPFEALFSDAVRYAREGFQVGPKTAAIWQHATKQFADFPTFQKTFAPGGRAPLTGEIIRLPDHAKTLESIAATNGESFYKGPLALAMAEASQKEKGTLTQEDLAKHKAEWVEPISMNAFDAELNEIPPNGQGLMALMSLGILKHCLDDEALDSADSIHLQIEAQRIAYTEMAAYLGDPDYMQLSVKQLLDPEYLKVRASTINKNKANTSSVLMGASDDTVYLTACDANGLMVSMIQSNYRGFGSGVVIPNTGISMQNRGSGFVLTPGHPNQVGPGKKPFHTIIPGFITRSGSPFMSFGVMGGHMQAQGHLQMMLRVMHYGQNPQAALDAPRWHVMENGKVALEDGIENTVIEDLKSRGHDIVTHCPQYLFGGGQAIIKMADGYCGGSDHRKEGLATGF